MSTSLTGISGARFYRARVGPATSRGAGAAGLFVAGLQAGLQAGLRAGLLAGLLAGPLSGAVPAHAQALPPVRVAFLGDSLTAGMGLGRDEAYPSVLQRRLAAEGRAIQVVNAGVSGDTSAGGVRRLDWVLRSRPDVLVVALGANDGLRGLPVAELEKNLRAIVGRAKQDGIDVLLAGMRLPPSLGPAYTTAFDEVYPRVSKELDVPLVPFLLADVGGVAELNQPDGIHPTAAGQEKVADNVLPHLRALLDRRRAAAR